MGVAVTCHAFANNKHFKCEHQPAAQIRSEQPGSTVKAHFTSGNLISFLSGCRKKPTYCILEQRNKQMTCLQNHPYLFFFLHFPLTRWQSDFRRRVLEDIQGTKLFFLGSGIGLNRCQTKCFFTHRQKERVACWHGGINVRTLECSGFRCWRRLLWGGEVMHGNLSQSPPMMEVRGSSPATQVDTGSHECLIGLLSQPGGDFDSPLSYFKYSLSSDISPTKSAVWLLSVAPSAVLSPRCRTVIQNALFPSLVRRQDGFKWVEVGRILSQSDITLPPLRWG